MKRSPSSHKPSSPAASHDARHSPFAEPLGRAGDAFEREADRVADAVSRGGLATGAGDWSAATSPEGTIRRAPKDSAPEPAAVAAPVEPAAVPDAVPDSAPADDPRAEAGPALLVEDDAEPGRGQMRRSEFFASLRSEICGTVDAAVRDTGRDSQGCPWIDHWLGYYEGRSIPQVERSLTRYAPEARGASSAQDYIGFVTARVRVSAQTWAETGEIVGAPDDIPLDMPGGSLLSGFAGMFFKARPGGPRRQNAESVREQLGEGQPLPGEVRARMGSAFGTGFDDVRLHSDATGAKLSDRLNARAFTLGKHVAFGAGEFRPGTVEGDALIAHELAHVVQQGGARTSDVMAKGPGGEAPLEADADRSAIAVMQSLWTGTRQSMGNVRANALPRLRSGLALSRCKSERQKEIERLGGVQLAFLEERRKAEEERLRKEAEEDAKKKGLPPPPAPKVDLADITKKDSETFSLPASPTKEWDEADQPAWKARAAAAWSAVVASVKGTELESVADGVHFNFDPAAALKGGFYASQNGHTLTVGMSWVKIAEKDPKNVWENLAHEMAGHLEYGTTYSSEIMDAALSTLPSAERKRVRGDEQNFFEAYEYPETEIYASLWQRRYRVPVVGAERESGGIHPDENIVKRLNVMKNTLAPEVALAVLKELKRRVDANPNILQRDKDFYVAKVKEVLKIDL